MLGTVVTRPLSTSLSRQPSVCSALGRLVCRVPVVNWTGTTHRKSCQRRCVSTSHFAPSKEHSTPCSFQCCLSSGNPQGCCHSRRYPKEPCVCCGLHLDVSPVCLVHHWNPAHRACCWVLAGWAWAEQAAAGTSRGRMDKPTPASVPLTLVPGDWSE